MVDMATYTVLFDVTFEFSFENLQHIINNGQVVHRAF